MEKRPSKSMNKILRLLPKAAQASVSFQNPHFSPARDKRASGSSQKLTYRPFSGPIIPAEAREESKNFETQEPTSPKISCMGQIKHKKRICKMQHASSPTELKPVSHSRAGKLSRTVSAGPAAELQKKAAGIKKVFGGRRKHADDSFNQGKPPLPDRAPCLSQMMRFASSRDTIACYDWTTEGGGGGCDFYSGEVWGSYSDGDDDLAPILAAGAEAGFICGLALEPRKEINLWKRRTVAQLKPLQLNTPLFKGDNE